MQFEFVIYNFNKANERESPFFSIKLSTANTKIHILNFVKI